MIGYNRVILIDAIQSTENHPGIIRRMTLEDLKKLSPTQHSTSPHDTTLITALELGHHMGLDLPDSITIFAIEVKNVLDFSEQLTPAVAAAIPEVTSAVLEELM